MRVTGNALRNEVPLNADLLSNDGVGVLEARLVAVDAVLDDVAVGADREECLLLLFFLSVHFGEAEIGQDFGLLVGFGYGFKLCAVL